MGQQPTACHHRSRPISAFRWWSRTVQRPSTFLCGGVDSSCCCTMVRLLPVACHLLSRVGGSAAQPLHVACPLAQAYPVVGCTARTSSCTHMLVVMPHSFLVAVFCAPCLLLRWQPSSQRTCRDSARVSSRRCLAAAARVSQPRIEGVSLCKIFHVWQAQRGVHVLRAT